MIFTEYRFAVFFAIVFAVHWTLRHHTARKRFLLLTSYVFYGWWDWRFLGLILLSTLVDFYAAKAIERNEERHPRKRWLQLSLFVNLGLLGIFKYFDFFTDSMATALTTLGLEVSVPVLNIGLPVGISFYTFQTMSYTLDIYRGKLRATDDLLDMALFVGFFPQLVAGPIVRAREFLPQLVERKRWSDVRVQALLWLFLIGFFKKACVSDNICQLVDAYYADPGMHSVGSSFLALFGFAVQLYCDFSGYSDMAIALAGLLGYQLPLNFDFPYFASNASQFWARWHITLSGWLHDYVFRSLGEGRMPRWRIYVNLCFTMTLVGLWHGAAWTFVFWGVLQGLTVVGYRMWHRRKVTARLPTVLRSSLGALLTFHWFMLGGVIFRAKDLGEALQIYEIMLGVQPAGELSFGTTAPWVILALGLVHFFFFYFKPNDRIAALPPVAFAALYGVLVPVTLAFARADVRPFIYFQF